MDQSNKTECPIELREINTIFRSASRTFDSSGCLAVLLDVKPCKIAYRAVKSVLNSSDEVPLARNEC